MVFIEFTNPNLAVKGIKILSIYVYHYIYCIYVIKGKFYRSEV